jgi:cellulose synthase/poly-beta-1,6-N-acetylglucosamine synthase-like glycosyltransferase
MTLRASVIITTHNEGASIRATLLGLAQDRAFREGWAEVVLVDDRSTDDTVAQALSVDLPALRLLRAAPDPASPLTTRQQALDLGFRAAASPIILTLDADSTLPRDWIAQMIAPIEAGQAQAIAGPIGFAPLTSAVARWQCCDTAYYFLVSGLMARAGLGGGVFFGNFAFRADLYTRLGGFDAIGFALTEDLAFALALQRAGLCSRNCPRRCQTLPVDPRSGRAQPARHLRPAIGLGPCVDGVAADSAWLGDCNRPWSGRNGCGSPASALPDRRDDRDPRPWSPPLCPSLRGGTGL